ncbi:MAG: metallophosphoesterase [Clostridia bacterium]|nr:metallophosphoesterase [Clostridia bacterium]
MEKKNKIRIMHMADVHLDSPFSRLETEKVELRRRELRGVFTSMMLYARVQRVDLVLIAGDLFDVEYAGEDTLSLIIREFEKAPECRFVIAAGNHDPYSAHSAYKQKSFPENVYIFGSPALSRFRFDDIGVDVYGWSFVCDILESAPLRDMEAEDTGNIPLLCAHADMTSAVSKYAPVTTADIERFGAVYSALGHIHRGTGISRLPSGAVYGYSGSPSGRSYDECGAGGAYIADIERSGESCSVSVRFEQFSVGTYEDESLDMTGVMTRAEARERICGFIREQRYGEHTSLRLTLTGLTGAEVGAFDSFDARELGLFSLLIRDRTSPSFDAERFSTDMTIRGAYFRVLAGMLESEDEGERAIASEALRVGFAALDGSDITR